MDADNNAILSVVFIGALRISGDGIAASLQARANRTPIGIGPRPPRGRGLIDLLLGLMCLRLRIGIRRRPDDGARSAADDRTGAGIARPPDDRTDDGAADQSDRSARSRGIRRLNDHPLVGARIRAARIHAGLLDRPEMTFVTIAFRLFRALTVSRI